MKLRDRFLVATVALQICLCFIVAVLPCHSKMVIDLTNPNLTKMPLAIPDFVGTPVGPVNGRDLAAILKADLRLTGLFSILEMSPGVIQTA